MTSIQAAGLPTVASDTQPNSRKATSIYSPQFRGGDAAIALCGMAEVPYMREGRRTVPPNASFPGAAGRLSTQVDGAPSGKHVTGYHPVTHERPSAKQKVPYSPSGPVGSNGALGLRVPPKPYSNPLLQGSQPVAPASGRRQVHPPASLCLDKKGAAAPQGSVLAYDVEHSKELVADAFAQLQQQQRHAVAAEATELIARRANAPERPQKARVAPAHAEDNAAVIRSAFGPKETKEKNAKKKYQNALATLLVAEQGSEHEARARLAQRGRSSEWTLGLE